jgi:hypothetical protein
MKTDKKYKRVPICAARRIAQCYEKNQVIIITWDTVHRTSHVTTYGRSKQDCLDAELAGNELKRALGWPETAIKLKDRK